MAVEPTITCPGCRTDFKPTESLAAPLIEVTRQQYETKLAQQTAEFIFAWSSPSPFCGE